MPQTSLISRINELPRIQRILQELLEMVNQDDVDFTDLSNKIVMDQVLAARLLRLANSAHFGGQKNIASVNEAVIRVGAGPVRTLVVASVLSGVFKNVPTLNLEEYWSDTFEVSVIASKLAEKTQIDSNAMFTIGILHNIGELMIHTLVPNEAEKINVKIQSGEDRFAAQEAVIDVSAPALGALLAKNWNFPSDMTDAIAHFNQPREAEISPKLAVILHFAHDIQTSWPQLSSKQDKMEYLAQHPDARLLSIDPEFSAIIDEHLGQGQELAHQLLAA